MILPRQSMATTAELADELGVSPDTVSRWAKTRLAFARWSRGRFLVQPLRDAGVLPRLPASQEALCVSSSR